jgi:hypothetical protein
MMPTELQNIIGKYEEFNSFLKGINVKDFEQYDRATLKEFNEELRKHTNFRILSLEISDIIDRKKKEEYPELLGVHHYPEIKKIDFLSEEDKINLDNYIVSIGCSRYLYKGSNAWYTLSKKWSKDIQEKVLQFLVDEGIIKRMYKMEVCHDSLILSEEEINNYLKYFEMGKRKKELTDEEWGKYYELEQNLEIYHFCMDCDSEITIKEEDIQNVLNSKYCHVCKVIKERDKSLDNV